MQSNLVLKICSARLGLWLTDRGIVDLAERSNGGKAHPRVVLRQQHVQGLQ